MTNFREIAVNINLQVGVNDIVDVEIVALDEHGEEIPHKSDALSNVKLETSNDRATLQR